MARRLSVPAGSLRIVATDGIVDISLALPAFRKILVANRGEIAVRAFRAAYELGSKTVAVFPYEDRGSEHRLKADESYEIGEHGHPVRAYLDPELIVGAAVASGAVTNRPMMLDSTVWMGRRPSSIWTTSTPWREGMGYLSELGRRC